MINLHLLTIFACLVLVTWQADLVVAVLLWQAGAIHDELPY